MKVAVCFSGLIRMGCLCSSNLFKYFGDIDVDFFIHTWDYENQAPSLLESLHRDTPIWENTKIYRPHPLQESKRNKFLELYKPKKFLIESFDIFENNRIIALTENKPRLILPLWVSFKRSIEIMDEYQKENNIQYDYVVKLRPDLLIKPGSFLIDDINLLKTYDENSLLICNLGGEEQLSENSVFTDDVLYIGGTNTMIKASKHGSIDNETHEYFMRFLLKNKIKPYNANTSIYTILRPHLVHLDVNKDFDLIHRECSSYYLPKELYNEIYK